MGTRFLLLIFLPFLFLSCSLKEGEELDIENIVPEFVFSNAKMTRYENNSVTLELNAETIEQYKNSSQTFAKEVEFSSYEKNKLTTEGSCDYISANTDEELYSLYGNIEIYSKDQNVNFFADELKWNAKTNQLIGGKSDTVRIEKDNTVIIGSGFAASGVSGKFSFSGSVSGDIETE